MDACVALCVCACPACRTQLRASADFRNQRKYRETSVAAPVGGPLLWQLEWQRPWWFKNTCTRPCRAINSIPDSHVHQKQLRVGSKRPGHSFRTVARLFSKSVQVSRVILLPPSGLARKLVEASCGILLRCFYQFNQRRVPVTRRARSDIEGL